MISVKSSMHWMDCKDFPNCLFHSLHFLQWKTESNSNNLPNPWNFFFVFDQYPWTMYRNAFDRFVSSGVWATYLCIEIKRFGRGEMQTNRSNVYQKKEEERQETSFCPGQKTGKEDWSDYFRYCISYREASLLVFRIFWFSLRATIRIHSGSRL